MMIEKQISNLIPLGSMMFTMGTLYKSLPKYCSWMRNSGMNYLLLLTL